jgi:hypothetical protein
MRNAACCPYECADRCGDDIRCRGDWLAAARAVQRALTAIYPRNGQVWFGLSCGFSLVGRRNVDDVEGYIAY